MQEQRRGFKQTLEQRLSDEATRLREKNTDATLTQLAEAEVNRHAERAEAA